MGELQRSRVARSAAQVAGGPESESLHRLDSVPVVLRLADDSANARFCFLTALRLALLTFGNVKVAMQRSDATLMKKVQALSVSMRGSDHPIQVVDATDIKDSDFVLVIGRIEVRGGRAVAVGSHGWVARVAVSGPSRDQAVILPRAASREPNAIGSSAAAALGIGELFLGALGVGRPAAAFDCSFLAYETADVGTLDIGPAIQRPITLNGIQIGAGTVGGAFDYVAHELRLEGHLAIVDPQRVGTENYGPHLLVGAADFFVPKVRLAVKRLKRLRNLRVKGYLEPVQLFVLRLGSEIPIPDVVVSGLDRAQPRHIVQRLWAPLHIDMATGGVGGLQSQVLVRANPGSGRCLIEAFTVDGEEPDEERWATMTGVGTDRFSDPMSLISLADVEAAPEEKRADLLEAHRLGQRVCNVVIASELGARNDSTDFAAAAPFNALLAGTMAAGELMQSRDRDRDGVFTQYNLVSRAFFSERTRSADDCECMIRHGLPKLGISQATG